MDAIGMLMKSFGVQIDSKEIEAMLNQAKVVLPKIGPFLNQAYATLNARLEAIEKQQAEILKAIEHKHHGGSHEIQ